MGSSVASISNKMGNALKTGMGRGISATKKSLASMGSGMKNLLSKIGGLASAATVGLLVRDAIKMNHQYRNIAFNVNKIKGNAIKWQEVQKLVEQASSSARSAITTEAPSLANSRTSSAPIPLAPPLISATLPSSRTSLLLSRLSASAGSIGAIVRHGNEFVHNCHRYGSLPVFRWRHQCGHQATRARVYAGGRTGYNPSACHSQRLAGRGSVGRWSDGLTGPEGWSKRFGARC